MVCADRISLQCPAGAARVNSEADHLRRFLILKDCIESSYCAVDHTTSTSNSLIVVVSRNLFLLLSLCFDSPCLGQLTMSSTFITPCSLRKWARRWEATFLRRRRPALLAHSKSPRSKCFIAACIWRIDAYRTQVLICCGLPTALSRQRLNRDAFLSAAAIRL